MQEIQETWVQSLGLEDPLEESMATTPELLPGESHGQRSLVGYSPWGRKESDSTERLNNKVLCSGNYYQLKFSLKLIQINRKPK